MKTKIVYVLVSEETDFFYEMVLLSLYSLRIYHPKDNVELVMDMDTYDRLVDKKASILNDVMPIVVPIPPDYSVMQRSRYLKTCLRQIIKGDYLFLDCDTLICRKLDDIDTIDTDLAMVSNLHGKCYEPTHNNDMWGDNAEDNHLGEAPHYYFNSGVMFARDSDVSHRLFETWHSLWKQSVGKGVPQDQPALWRSIVQGGFTIKELPAAWNCQLFHFENACDRRSAFIFHYFSNKNSLLRTHLFEYIKAEGAIHGFAAKIARQPLSLGYTVFSMKDKRALEYLYSDNLPLFDNVPGIYRLFESLSLRLVKPLRWLSRIKQSVSKS